MKKVGEQKRLERAGKKRGPGPKENCLLLITQRRKCFAKYSCKQWWGTYIRACIHKLLSNIISVSFLLLVLEKIFNIYIYI